MQARRSVFATDAAPRADASFLAELLRLVRADAASPAGPDSDFDLLAAFIRREGGEAPGDPDPDVFWRIELFYRAVAATVERRTGVSCEPMLRMHHDGGGRVALVAGRLAVVSAVVRDAGRFGFESIDALAGAGERLVSGATALLDRHPDLAGED